MSPVSRRRFLQSLAVLAAKDVFITLPATPTSHQIITPNEDFFTLSYSPYIPQRSLEDWQLVIGGLVENRPLTLTWHDLQQFPTVERMHTLACIGNSPGGKLIGNALWQGVLWRDIMRSIPGIKPEAVRARLYGLDGYQTAVDLDWLLQPDTLLAYAMNGQRLTPQQGTFRILIPGLYGQKMPKWLGMIEFINYPLLGYWESRGWSDQAEIQTHAMITSPQNGAQILEPVTLQGIALSSLHEIVSVEVRINRGRWLPVMLEKSHAPHIWSQWFFNWTPRQPGANTIEVRATDASGFTQVQIPGKRLASPKPNGSRAIHKITLWVGN